MPENYGAKIFSSKPRTATEDSPDQQNREGRGVHIVIDVTKITDAPSVVPKIQGIDPESGKPYDILVGDAIGTTGINVLKVYPGITGSAKVAANDSLPLVWRLRMEHGNADSITYSAGANVVI